jgi:hypothetical protein
MRKKTGDPRAEDKKKKKSSNGEGARWQEQNEGESAGGKNGGATKVKTAVFSFPQIYKPWACPPGRTSRAH